MTPKNSRAIGNGERRAAVPRNAVGNFRKGLRHIAPGILHKLSDGVRSAFAQSAAIDIHAAHPCIGGERNKVGFVLGDFATAQAVFLLGQHDDRAPLWRFVGKAGKLRGIRQFAFGHSVDR